MKTNYLKCEFSERERGTIGVRIGGITIPKLRSFGACVDLTNQRDIDEDTIHRIRIG